jgi:hypothetical protein
MSPAHGAFQQAILGDLAVRDQRGAMCTTRRTGLVGQSKSPVVV